MQPGGGNQVAPVIVLACATPAATATSPSSAGITSDTITITTTTATNTNAIPDAPASTLLPHTTPNAFMIYRRDRSAEIMKIYLESGGSATTIANASSSNTKTGRVVGCSRMLKVAGMLWRDEPESVREEYRRKAENNRKAVAVAQSNKLSVLSVSPKSASSLSLLSAAATATSSSGHSYSKRVRSNSYKISTNATQANQPASLTDENQDPSTSNLPTTSSLYTTTSSSAQGGRKWEATPVIERCRPQQSELPPSPPPLSPLSTSCQQSKSALTESILRSSNNNILDSSSSPCKEGQLQPPPPSFTSSSVTSAQPLSNSNVHNLPPPPSNIIRIKIASNSVTDTSKSTTTTNENFCQDQEATNQLLRQQPFNPKSIHHGPTNHETYLNQSSHMQKQQLQQYHYQYQLMQQQHHQLDHLLEVPLFSSNNNPSPANTHLIPPSNEGCYSIINGSSILETQPQLPPSHFNFRPPHLSPRNIPQPHHNFLSEMVMNIGSGGCIGSNGGSGNAMSISPYLTATPPMLTDFQKKWLVMQEESLEPSPSIPFMDACLSLSPDPDVLSEDDIFMFN